MSYSGSNDYAKQQFEIDTRRQWKYWATVYGILVLPISFVGCGLAPMAFDGCPPCPTELSVLVYNCMSVGPIMFITLLMSCIFYKTKRYEKALYLFLLPSLNVFIFLALLFVGLVGVSF